MSIHWYISGVEYRICRAIGKYLHLHKLTHKLLHMKPADEHGFLLYTVIQLAAEVNLLRMITLAYASGETGEAHPNGFLRMPLFRCGQGSERLYEIRLHVWDTLDNFLNNTPSDNSKEFIEDIHDHRVTFATRCLTGGYDNVVYEAATTSAPVTAVHAMVAKKCYDARGAHFELTRAAPAPIAHHSTHKFCAGTSYVMSDHVLHRVTNLQPGTITLTLRGVDRGKATTRLWTTDPDTTIKEATPLGVLESRLVYKRLLEVLFP